MEKKRYLNRKKIEELLGTHNRELLLDETGADMLDKVFENLLEEELEQVCSNAKSKDRETVLREDLD